MQIIQLARIVDEVIELPLPGVGVEDELVPAGHHRQEVLPRLRRERHRQERGGSILGPAHEAPSGKIGRAGEAEDVEQCGHEVHQAHPFPFDAGVANARSAEDEGDTEERVVELVDVSHQAVVAHALAVIGGEDDQRVLEVAARSQGVEKPTDLAIDIGDLPVVAAPLLGQRNLLLDVEAEGRGDRLRVRVHHLQGRRQAADHGAPSLPLRRRRPARARPHLELALGSDDLEVVEEQAPSPLVGYLGELEAVRARLERYRELVTVAVGLDHAEVSPVQHHPDGGVGVGGRRVGLVGVRVVDEEEETAPVDGGSGGDGGVGDLVSRPKPLGGEAGIDVVEALGEAEPGGEDTEADHGRGPETVALEHLSDGRLLRPEDVGVLLDTVVQGQLAGEHRRVAGAGDGDVGGGVLEANTRRRETVDGGRRHRTAVAGESVRAQRVDDDPEKVPGRAGRCRVRVAAAPPGPGGDGEGEDEERRRAGPSSSTAARGAGGHGPPRAAPSSSYMWCTSDHPRRSQPVPGTIRSGPRQRATHRGPRRPSPPGVGCHPRRGPDKAAPDAWTRFRSRRELVATYHIAPAAGPEAAVVTPAAAASSRGPRR